MNNPAGTLPVPLTVFGGAVTEMAPEDLPEGASPFNQDVDYLPGAVLTRGGRQSVYSFNGLFAEDLAGFAITVPTSPGAEPWVAPLNATLNIPGTYAIVTLNAGAGGGPGLALDKAVFANGSSALASASATPARAGEVALYLSEISAAGSPLGAINPATGWSLLDNPNGALSSLYAKYIPDGNLITETQTLVNSAWVTALILLGSSNAGTPVMVQKQVINSGAFAAGTYSATFPAPITAGNAIVVVYCKNNSTQALSGVSCTDSKLNPYTLLGITRNGLAEETALLATNAAAGTTQVNFTFAVGFGAGTIVAYEISGIGSLSATQGISQVLKASNFNFNIPVTQSIIGVQVEISGHQTTRPVDAILAVTLSPPAGLIPGPIAIREIDVQLPLVDAQVTAGSATELWALPLTPAILNNPNFAVNILASAATLQTFDVYAIKLKVFTSPQPPANFNYIKTFEQTSGQIDTLALDANGVLWDENVTSTPNILNGIYTGITPNTFAKSVTFEDVEYIALSNLLTGTDIPRHWDGTFLDRVSQVGPGAPPSVNATSTIFQIAPTPNGITQLPPVTIGDVGGGGGHGGISSLLWSAGPGNTSTGNTLTLYYGRVTVIPVDPNIVAGQGIRIQGLPLINGQDPNGTYIVTSVGSGVPPNPNFGTANQYFTVKAASSQSAFFFQANNPIVGSSYQVTLATLTTLIPLPNTQIGSQITVSGVPVAAWNAVWTVLATPNAGTLAITQTQLSGNVATYTFTLISGVAPTVGQQVTIVGCLNGPIVGGTSIFNISNGIVAAIGANQFSVNITAGDVLPAAESGNATVNGTKFQFDPGIVFAGTGTNPIFGNSGGGQVVVGGAGLGAGLRKAVLMFLTRNGLISPASPPVTFSTTGGSTSLAFLNIAIGPPDVTARIIAITGAGGDNFFWMPQPTITQASGQNVTYTSSKIADNTSTQAVLTFTDAILLAGTAIDTPGNNLFNQIELGSSLGFLTYANRLIAIGEQNKIQNLLNLSFDGGIGIGTGGVGTSPLGWTVDPILGGGGSLLVSPVFGNSYYIRNATGGVQATYGMIEQGAFIDAYQVPILQPLTKYSVRITARCPSGAASGNLAVDFFSPLQNRIFGSFTVPLASMSSNFAIFTGTLLTTTFSTVPADLLFRVYTTSLPNNSDCEIDRVEPFPTLQPVFSTQLRASYAGNQEAFDLVTGAFGPNQNQQPLNGAFVMYDVLYALKEKSMFSTSDNGVTEPNEWNFREVSPKVGTVGIHSYDSGEGWAITGCRPGLYFFEGGEPTKISQEIQSVWDLINWKYGHTIWVRNDEQLKRITVGVPIPTPNPFMPEFPLNANPTSPNVILMCSYRELNTGSELAHTGPIRSTFSGRLMSPEPARKWSFWNIACPYADFISRANNQWPEFFCNGYANSKIFQLSSVELDDDGAAINSFYVTYGFVKPEMAEAKGLGLFGMELDYLTMLITGNGSILPQVYADSVQDPLPFQLDTLPMQAFSQGDCELAVNITANRFFIRVGSNAVGASFRLSKVVAALSKGAWSEIRGTNVGAG